MVVLLAVAFAVASRAAEDSWYVHPVLRFEAPRLDGWQMVDGDGYCEGSLEEAYMAVRLIAPPAGNPRQCLRAMAKPAEGAELAARGEEQELRGPLPGWRTWIETRSERQVTHSEFALLLSQQRAYLVGGDWPKDARQSKEYAAAFDRWLSGFAEDSRRKPTCLEAAESLQELGLPELRLSLLCPTTWEQKWDIETGTCTWSLPASDGLLAIQSLDSPAGASPREAAAEWERAFVGANRLLDRRTAGQSAPVGKLAAYVAEYSGKEIAGRVAFVQVDPQRCAIVALLCPPDAIERYAGIHRRICDSLCPPSEPETPESPPSTEEDSTSVSVTRLNEDFGLTERYQRNGLPLAVSFPDDFRLFEEEPNGVRFAAKASDRFQVFVSRTAMNGSDDDLARAFDGLCGMLKEEQRTVNLTKAEPCTTPDGSLKGLSCQARGEFDGVRMIKRIYLVRDAAGGFYLVVTGAPKDAFPQYAPTFVQMFDSLRPVPPQRADE